MIGRMNTPSVSRPFAEAPRCVRRIAAASIMRDFHFDPKTNIVESHISRLRSKLSQYGGAELIHTVRGAGYALRAPLPGNP